MKIVGLMVLASLVGLLSLPACAPVTDIEDDDESTDETDAPLSSYEVPASEETTAQTGIVRWVHKDEADATKVKGKNAEGAVVFSFAMKLEEVGVDVYRARLRVPGQGELLVRAKMIYGTTAGDEGGVETKILADTLTPQAKVIVDLYLATMAEYAMNADQGAQKDHSCTIAQVKLAASVAGLILCATGPACFLAGAAFGYSLLDACDKCNGALGGYSCHLD